jgi:gluconokinase
MNVGELILAVDIGTGATKAVLFDARLAPVNICRSYHTILNPVRGWSEQEPEAIYQAVLSAIGESLAAAPTGSKVKCVVLSSQLYSVLAVAPDGKLLSNSLTWSDTRSAGIAERLRRDPSIQQIRGRCGCPIDSVYPFAKIHWLRENLRLPEATRFVSIKEYIIYRLTGEWIIDWALASATGLFDIHRLRWDPAALSSLGIREDNLSRLVPPRAVLPGWTTDAHEKAGVSPGLPLVIGGGDGQLASLGVGAAASGAMAVNVGTSAAARALVREPQVDPDGRLWTYVVDEGLWVTGGMVSSGGIVFEWFLNNFMSAGGSASISTGEAAAIAPDLYAYVDRLASAVPPGAEDLLFIPYLSGAQAPDWLPRTRGSFNNIDLRHTRGHFSRAVLEGVARSIYRIAEVIEERLDRHFSEVYVTGGLTASEVWLQVAADMFGSTIALPVTSEGSARGAAMLAMLALGMRSSYQDFDGWSEPARKVYPNPASQAVYREQRQRFLSALEASRAGVAVKDENSAEEKLT